MIFSVENGSFAYKDDKILQDINFNVSSGNILSILGPNGVGKTTLLKCMMGILKWSTGSTKIDGTDISKINSKKLWSRIGYVPQAKQMVFGLTAIDMVLLGLCSQIGVFSKPNKNDYENARKVLREIKIEHLEEKLCTQMSGGELQMVLIARALIANPELLILDEPESNLDFKNQLIILDTIQRLSKEKNIATIVNTHYPEHALKISNKSLLLSKDEEPIFGDSNSVINNKNLEKLFGVEVYIDEFTVNKKNYKCVVPISVV